MIQEGKGGAMSRREISFRATHSIVFSSKKALKSESRDFL